MERPPSFEPGAQFEYRITFAKELDDGTFPRAFLRGPDTLDEEYWKELATEPTIVPQREGGTYILRGQIPKNAEVGLYALDRVEILFSKTGMNDTKLVKKLSFNDLDPFAIIVEKPAPPRASEIPSVVRRT